MRGTDVCKCLNLFNEYLGDKLTYLHKAKNVIKLNMLLLLLLLFFFVSRGCIFFSKQNSHWTVCQNNLTWYFITVWTPTWLLLPCFDIICIPSIHVKCLCNTEWHRCHCFQLELVKFTRIRQLWGDNFLQNHHVLFKCRAVVRGKKCLESYVGMHVLSLQGNRR